MIEVRLSLSELQQAILVGGQRRLRALHAGRTATYGEPEQRGVWDVDVEAAAAEMSVAKALNVYWGDDPRLDYHGDVGPLHVRSTDHLNGHLLVYPRDPDEAFFVLVVGRAPVFRIPGLIHGTAAKSERFYQPDRLRVPCFMVPQTELSPLVQIAEAA